MVEIHLLVEREVGTDDACWVIDAVDEYTLDEHNGGYPSDFKTKLEKTGDGNERRVLIVRLPDGSLEKPWRVPVVEGQVISDGDA